MFGKKGFITSPGDLFKGIIIGIIIGIILAVLMAKGAIPGGGLICPVKTAVTGMP